MPMKQNLAAFNPPSLLLILLYGMFGANIIFGFFETFLSQFPATEKRDSLEIGKHRTSFSNCL
jgi:hypothetical protein